MARCDRSSDRVEVMSTDAVRVSQKEIDIPFKSKASEKSNLSSVEREY